MAEKFAAKYISIHALREEDDVRQSVSRFTSGISIHALCEEDDVGIAARIVEVQVISIHALREEGDRWVLSTLFMSA